MVSFVFERRATVMKLRRMDVLLISTSRLWVRRLRTTRSNVATHPHIASKAGLVPWKI